MSDEDTSPRDIHVRPTEETLQTLRKFIANPSTNLAAKLGDLFAFRTHVGCQPPEERETVRDSCLSCIMTASKENGYLCLFGKFANSDKNDLAKAIQAALIIAGILRANGIEV